MQVKSLNLIPPCLWNDIISFLFWHAFSAIKTLALWKPPLNTPPPPPKPPEFVFFLSWTSKEFPWNVALFFYQTGWCIIHPSIHPSIHVPNNKLSDPQKKPLLVWCFFSRTHFEINMLINVDHVPIIFVEKVHNPEESGSLIPPKSRSLTSIVMPCWDGHCQVSKIAGDMKATVDGRDPAPPGMYKTL